MHVSVTQRDLRALDKLATAVWIFDVRGQRMLWANRAALPLWRADSLAALLERDFAADMSLATQRRLTGYLERFARGEAVEETWTFYPEGKVATVHCHCRGVVLSDEGAPGEAAAQLMMLVEARPAPEVDVVDLRGMESLRHTTVLITLCDFEGKVLMQNPAADEAYERGHDDERHLLHRRLVDPEQADEILEALAAGRVFSDDVQVRTRRGVRWHALQARVTNDPGGGGQALLINEQNISRLKETQGELMRAQEELEDRVRARTAELSAAATTLERGRSFVDAILDTVASMVIVVDGEGRIVRVNRAAVELSGYAEGALVGEELTSLLPAVGQPVLDGSAEGCETALVQASGEQRLLSLTLAPLPGDGPQHLIVTGVDITEQRELQLRLQMSDRLVTLGTLAAGVAHDINNPLAFARTNLELLGEELQAASGDLLGALPRYQELVQEGLTGVCRVGDIVQELNAFQRAMVDRVGPIDLHAVLRSALKLADTETRHRAQLRLDLEPVPPVRSSASRLGQVFLNLLINAAQALPVGQAEQHWIHLTCRRHGEWIVVEVRDNGGGIEAADLPRIFEPFFTTKSGSGSGLGLSNSKRIVEEAGGTIMARNTERGGACFTVRLPVLDAPLEEPAASPRLVAVPSEVRQGRVLIIDDEPAIGRALRRGLRREHEVFVVESGRDGLELLVAEPVDVVLCDLMMPELTGEDVFRQVQRDFPQLAERFVFMTGGAFTARSRAFLEDLGAPCIAKPFDISEVREIVAGLLESRTAL